MKLTAVLGQILVVAPRIARHGAGHREPVQLHHPEDDIERGRGGVRTVVVRFARGRDEARKHKDKSNEGTAHGGRLARRRGSIVAARRGPERGAIRASPATIVGVPRRNATHGAHRPVPEIRPFRALRYEPESVGDIGSVVAPPYDVIKPAEHQALLERNSRNIVRLDLPDDEPGDEPGDRYRRAARTLAAWRSDGTFRKDPRPAIYVYEQSYRVPGTDVERTQRGFYARLRLEPFGPRAGILPHERTLSAPREDRYMLLRATGVNTSPIVALFEDPDGRARALLAGMTAADAPAVEVTDPDGTRHRLWVVQVGDGDSAGVEGSLGELLEIARTQPVLIADGHHRYETALRYRDERRMTRSCEEDPAFDYIVTLLLDTGEPLTVLPTHRVVRGLADGGRGLIARAHELFDVAAADRATLEAQFTAAVLSPGGRGRFGLWTHEGGAILTARRAAFEPILPAGSDALRRQDVTLLQVALDRLCGIDAAAVAAGRLSYTRSAREALDAVDGPAADADAAFLLEPTPVAAIADVARAGDVMPQKSTYFYPKALSGLLVNPLEW